jgi:hypothetical protein
VTQAATYREENPDGHVHEPHGGESVVGEWREALPLLPGMARQSVLDLLSSWRGIILDSAAPVGASSSSDCSRLTAPWGGTDPFCRRLDAGAKRARAEDEPEGDSALGEEAIDGATFVGEDGVEYVLQLSEEWAARFEASEARRKAQKEMRGARVSGKGPN